LDDRDPPARRVEHLPHGAHGLRRLPLGAWAAEVGVSPLRPRLQRTPGASGAIRRVGNAAPPAAQGPADRLRYRAHRRDVCGNSHDHQALQRLYRRWLARLVRIAIDWHPVFDATTWPSRPAAPG